MASRPYLISALGAALLGPWPYPRPSLRLRWQAPFLFSLGLAAFGWRLGWLLPGAAGAAYALGAPFFARRQAGN